jgi:hypothetical protein
MSVSILVVDDEPDVAELFPTLGSNLAAEEREPRSVHYS